MIVQAGEKLKWELKIQVIKSLTFTWLCQIRQDFWQANMPQVHPSACHSSCDTAGKTSSKAVWCCMWSHSVALLTGINVTQYIHLVPMLSHLAYHIRHCAVVVLLNYTHILGYRYYNNSLHFHDFWLRWKHFPACLCGFHSSTGNTSLLKLHSCFFPLALTTSGKTDEVGDSNWAKAAQ